MKVKGFKEAMNQEEKYYKQIIFRNNQEISWNS